MKFDELDRLVIYTVWHDDDDDRSWVIAYQQKPVRAFAMWDIPDISVVGKWAEAADSKPLLEVVLESDFVDVHYSDQGEYPVDVPQSASLDRQLARAINQIARIKPDDPLEAVNNALNTVRLLGVLLEAIKAADWEIFELL